MVETTRAKAMRLKAQMEDRARAMGLHGAAADRFVYEQARQFHAQQSRAAAGELAKIFIPTISLIFLSFLLYFKEREIIDFGREIIDFGLEVAYFPVKVVLGIAYFPVKVALGIASFPGNHPMLTALVVFFVVGIGYNRFRGDNAGSYKLDKPLVPDMSSMAISDPVVRT